MKIKTDFVTNSSSTSFVVMTKGELTLHSFLKAVGVSQESMFLGLFVKLFNLFKNDLNRLEYAAINYGRSSVEEYIEKSFSEDTQTRIRQARENGFEIYVGKLYSDNDEIETLFCCDAFVIEGDKLIIDATKNGW